MKKILFSVLFAGTLGYSFAQVPHKGCGTDHNYQQMVEQNPAIKANEQLFNEQAEARKGMVQRKAGFVRIIPVVFHIFHKAGTENITDAQIQNEVDNLNKNFRRQNANASQTRDIFEGVAADLEIEFRLARKDPDGNCTNGIVRVYEEETENGTNNIKIKSVWPTDRYLNVWVVENIVNFSGNLPGIAGYAQFPWSGSYNTDGVIILHDQIGAIGTSRPDNATTVTHEIGHWLGFFHTFQDSCLGGDKVDDTPPCADNRNGILSCDFNRNTCGNDKPDLPDQIENYMDYTVGTCQNMFTLGQKARMETTMEIWRPYLWSQKNLIETGTDVPNAPSNCGPVADFFSIDNQRSRSNVACAGLSTIDFRDNSYNYSGGITRQWIFEGGNPATSTATNPTVTYATPGKYKVTLIVSNSFGTDTVVKENYIEVVSTPATIKGPYTQDFEFPVFPTDGWYANSTTFTDYRVVDVGMGAAIQGNSRTLMAPNGNGIAGSRFDLYSPTMDISQMSSPVVSFYHSFVQRLNENSQPTADRLVIYYSTDCGQNWIQFKSIPGSQLNTVGVPNASSANNQSYVPSDKSKWKQNTTPIPGVISAAQRANIRFRFQFISAGGNNFYIDNINIGYPASIGHTYYNQDENFNVYPNPTHGQTTVSLNIIEESNINVTVVDMMGREVAVLANGKYQQGTQEFAFDASGNNVAGGLYFVKLTVNGNVYTKKLVHIE